MLTIWIRLQEAEAQFRGVFLLTISMLEALYIMQTEVTPVLNEQYISFTFTHMCFALH